MRQPSTKQTIVFILATLLISAFLPSATLSVLSAQRTLVLTGQIQQSNIATNASTVGATTTQYPATPQRRSFHASGLFWVFFSDGINMVYCTSSDGSSWSLPTTVRSANSGLTFSVFYDGTYIYYAYCPGGFGAGLYFRRGNPNSDGAITWSTNEVTVLAGVSGTFRMLPEVIADDNGYPWIGYSDDEGTAAKYYPFMIQATATDGSTWNTPVKMSTTDAWWRVCPVPLTSGKVYVVYVSGGVEYVGTFYGKLWDGSWGAEETEIIDYQCENNGFDWSITSKGDDVHLSYLRDQINPDTNEVRYAKRTHGSGWDVSDTLLQGNAAFDSVPYITVDTSTGDLYCFYPNAPTYDHIGYRKYNYSASKWETYVDLVSEAVSEDTMTCFSRSYDNYIGLLWREALSSSPYDMRFAVLVL